MSKSLDDSQHFLLMDPNTSTLYNNWRNNIFNPDFTKKESSTHKDAIKNNETKKES